VGEKMKTLTAKEIAEKHSKKCAHKFVMLEDVKEWLKQFLTDESNAYVRVFIKKRLDELEVK
jgi:hypothetical protein